MGKKGSIRLLISTGLSQDPCDGVVYYYRLKDFLKGFYQKLI